MVMEAKKSHDLVCKLVTRKAVVSFTESKGLRTRGPGSVAPSARCKTWKPGRCWCKSQSVRAWEPGALMSQGRRRQMFQLRKREGRVLAVVQWVEDLVLPKLLLRFNPWLGNVHMSQVQPKLGPQWIEQCLSTLVRVNFYTHWADSKHLSIQEICSDIHRNICELYRHPLARSNWHP